MNSLWNELVPPIRAALQYSMPGSQPSLAVHASHAIPGPPQPQRRVRLQWPGTMARPPGRSKFTWSGKIRNLFHRRASSERSPRFSSPGVGFFRGRLATSGNLSIKEVAVKASENYFEADPGSGCGIGRSDPYERLCAMEPEILTCGPPGRQTG